MAGSSSGSSWSPDSILPDVQFVLDWNPPRMSVGDSADVDMRPPDTVPKTRGTATIGSSRKAAFYDRHLASHLILQRVVHLDQLVSVMAGTVDKAIHDAIAKQPLPKDSGTLTAQKVIEQRVWEDNWTKYHESGIGEAYKEHTKMYCLPIASTLTIHPSSEMWGKVMLWTVDGRNERWAIADGWLFISPNICQDNHPVKKLLKNEDDGKIAVLKALASRNATLAVWEMKNLTVGTTDVMTEIFEMGVTHSKFLWTKCAGRKCRHKRLEDMAESEESYDEGVDPRSPPWTLPSDPSPPASTSRPPPMREGLRIASASASARGATTALSYREASLSSLDGEGVVGKRRHDGSDGSDGSAYKQPPSKKPKSMTKSDVMDKRDKDYNPSHEGQREVNAQSFLQQTWAETVRNKCTIMVLHSGNHEIIGIRHRKTQTLYISHVIEPHSCSNPAYGKLHVGIYIAALQETIDREMQAREATEKSSREAPADVSPEDEEANPDGDPDDHPGKRTRSNKREGNSGSERRPQGKDKRKGRQHTSRTVINNQLLANAINQDTLCLRFFYDIYDSPHPAAFRRVSNEPKEAASHVSPPTPPLSPGREKTPPLTPSIHITVHSELQPGSTGIVHIGTMEVDPSGPTTKVALKLAFSKDEKERLMQEHEVYSILHSKGVQGIPRDIGLFVDEEPLLGTEGPYALVMTYAGTSLFHRSVNASDSVKESLLTALESIHRANILHGDIRLPNLCATPFGEAFIVDFSHASESRSRKEKAQEVQDLSHILGMTTPSKPVGKAVQKPILRRSARIQELGRKVKVQTKNVQVKRGKATRRK